MKTKNNPQTYFCAVLGYCCIVVAFVLFVTAMPVFAQLSTGSILGVVKDSSGAVMPGAQVTARNAETGQSRSAVAGGDGEYRFSSLPVGHYDVSVAQSGFRTEMQRGLTLEVSQEAVINFTLQVGTAEQQVTVAGEVSLINTTNATLGGLVNEEKVAELPLNGRNYVNLTLLQTGVAQNTNVSASYMAGLTFSSGGAPVTSN